MWVVLSTAYVVNLLYVVHQHLMQYVLLFFLLLFTRKFLFIAFILPIHKFAAHELMNARNRRQNSYNRMRHQWGSIHIFSGAVGADVHRTETTSRTYYPFTRIFIRVLRFPFGPFKYTYRLPRIHLYDADTTFRTSLWYTWMRTYRART